MAMTRKQARDRIALLAQDGAGVLIHDGTPPQAILVSAGPSGPLTGTYIYRQTFLYPRAETAGGAPSTIVYAAQSGDLLLQKGGLQGPTKCIGRGIYRTKAGAADNTQQLVAIVSNDDVDDHYQDVTLDAALGAAMPTTPLASDYDNALQRALQAYSQVRPLKMVKELAGDGTGLVYVSALPQFDEGFIESLIIQWPVFQTPVPWADPVDRDLWEVWYTPTGTAIRFLRFWPTSDTTIRFIYPVPHQLPTNDTDPLTARASDHEMICTLGAAECDDLMAQFYSQTTEKPGLTADFSMFTTKAKEYETRAATRRAAFDAHIEASEDRARGSAVLARG